MTLAIAVMWFGRTAGMAARPDRRFVSGGCVVLSR
jgi:hypothetical protein